MDDSKQIRIRKLFLDLGTAESGRIVQNKFNHMIIAAESSANVLINVRVNEQANDSIELMPGKRLKNWPIEEMEISWAAQPGESCQLLYWDGPIVGPPEIVDDATTATISGNLAGITADVSIDDGGNSITIDDGGVALTPHDIGLSSYYSNVVSSSLYTVFTPASNTNGVIVKAISTRQSGNVLRLMIKQSAPTSFTDGVGIVAHGYAEGHKDVVLPFKIPAGYGLYYQVDGATSNSPIQINYEVL